MILVKAPVVSSHGFQFFAIDAATVEEAKRIWNTERDKAEYLFQEIEVEDLGEPEFVLEDDEHEQRQRSN